MNTYTIHYSFNGTQKTKTVRAIDASTAAKKASKKAAFAYKMPVNNGFTQFELQSISEIIGMVTVVEVVEAPAADRNEQRALAAMFCWNMAVDADIKARRCRDAGDHEGAKRHDVAVAHYIRNYTRLQYGDE